MSDEDEDSPEAFSLIDEAEVEEGADPRQIAAHLVATCDELLHLKDGEAAVLFLFRNDELIKAQKAVLGTMFLPRFMGPLGAVAGWMLDRMCGGERPDFIMVLDREFWRNADARTREALVFHELLHAAHALDKEGEPRFTDEGLPIWEIRGHDIEEFDDVVKRYGSWMPDLLRFKRALAEGDGS